MTKTFRMGPDPGGDNPATINLLTATAFTNISSFRYNESGLAEGGSFDSVPVGTYTYIDFNQASFVGDSTNDALIGTAGNDLIVWDGLTTGIGGPRYQLPTGVAAIDVFSLGNGDDVINLTYVDRPNVVDLPYTDKVIISGESGSDVIWSAFGNDELYGGSDNSGDTIFGGGGNDTIADSNGINVLSGDSGNDIISGGASFDNITGGFDNDELYGSAGADGVAGDDGNDTIFGGNESDLNPFGGDNLDGGTGDDTIYGGSGVDDVFGGIGDFDTLFGDSGDDAISDNDGAILTYGGVGNDQINIGFGPGWLGTTATIFGDAGNDVMGLGPQKSAMNLRIFGDSAAPSVNDGADTIVLSGAYNNIIAVLNGGDDRYLWSQSVVAAGNQIDTVFGGDGNDTIITGNGNDFLQGDAGNDTLYGGAGADSFVGGTGTDVISYLGSSAGVTMGLNGSVGIGGEAQGDTSATDVENLIGSNFLDSLTGNAGINVIQGLDGNDTVEGLGGGDSLFGGNGVDMLTYANSAAAVNVVLGAGGSGGDAQGDVIAADFENLTGSALDDTLGGSSTNNAIFGINGNDTIQGNGGLDSLYGGAGNDLLVYSPDGAIDGANEDDTIVLYSGDNFSANLTVIIGAAATFSGDIYDGGANIDSIQLTAGNDVLVANTNDLTIDGVQGAANTGQVVAIEVIDAGAGDDVVALNDAGASGGIAYATAITVAGNDGSDIVVTGAGNDLIYGDRLGQANSAIGAGDTLFSGAGSDSVFGNAGDDLIMGSSGADSLFGGQDNDTLSYSQSDAAVNVTLSGTGTGGYAQGDTIGADFENLVGSTFNDRLVGDGNANAVFGIDGADSMVGNGGNDTLYGGLGNDTFYGGTGVDSAFGDEGNDLFVAQIDGSSTAGELVVGWDGNGGFGSAQAQTVVLTAGANLVLDFMDGGDGGTDILDLRPQAGGVGSRNVVSFSLGTDHFQNLAGMEQIIAAGAVDIINLTYIQAGQGFAYSDNVTIVAGEASDMVFSGSGWDLIYGDNVVTSVGESPGADTLFGGSGNDTIFGDSPNGLAGGNDTIYGGFGDDTLYGGAGNDTISDSSDGTIFGGIGDDVITMRFTDNFAVGLIDGGPTSGVDGNDVVIVRGYYDHNSASLGAGDDAYISTVIDEPGDEGSIANRIDIVDGGSGNDAISTWYGNDIDSGGGGNDVLWGGSGGDTIYGGPGGDYLYGGGDDNDQLYGGGGEDYYYWGRTDGQGDQVFDLARTGQPADGTTNYIVVMGEFNVDESGPGVDYLLDGSGVLEADHNLANGTLNDGSNNMVRVFDLDGAGAGEIWRVQVLNGDGAGNFVDFDRRDVNGIALWNNDATPGTNVIQYYQWDNASHSYLFNS